MQLERKHLRPAQLSKMALAGLLIFTLLASLLFAVSPCLHEKLHHDAAQTSHQCAITIFEQQQLSTSNPHVIIVELNRGLAVAVHLRNFVASSEFNYRYSAARAPPFILSPLV